MSQRLLYRVMRKFTALFLLSLLLAPPAYARVVESIDVPETLNARAADVPLTLNGAGVRKRFFVKIYVGALYLPTPETNARTVLAASGPKSVRLHFLYKELESEKLTAAWTEGVRNNHGEADFQAVSERLNKFNGFFRTVKRGETIGIDFLANGETHVSINNETVGAVAGADFQRAILKVWLGDKPADDDLKRAMLGASE
jgi:hypothetical protein